MAVTAGITHLQGTGSSISIRTGHIVTLDARGTSSTNWPNIEYRHLLYVWVVSGGTPGSFTHGNGRVIPGLLRSPEAAFVFDTAGSYTITCTITEPFHGGTAVEVFNVTVEDPLNVKYFDSNAAGGGDGSIGSPWNDWETDAYPWWLSADTTDGACLFSAAGSSWNLTATLGAVNNLGGFRRMAKYGVGADPVFNCNGFYFLQAGTDFNSSDIVISDLSLNGTDNLVVPKFSGGLVRCTLHTQGSGNAVSRSGSGADGNGSDFALIDCDLVGGAYAALMFGPAVPADPSAVMKRIIMVSCSATDDGSGGEHCVRGPCRVIGCDLNWDKTDAGGKAALKLASEKSGTTVGDLCVMHSTITAVGYVGACVAITEGVPNADFGQVRLEGNLFFQINYLDSGPPLMLDANGRCSGLSMMNNKWVNVSGREAILSLSNYAHGDVRQYNETMISSSNSMILLRSQADPLPPIESKNNVAQVLGSGSYAYLFDLAGLVSDVDINGNWIDGPSSTVLGRFFDEAVPNQTFAAYDAATGHVNINGHGLDPGLDAGFDLEAGSPQIGAGLSMNIVPVMLDYGQDLRDPNAMDRGADQRTAYTPPGETDMAGGPIFPSSAVPDTSGEVFPYFLTTNNRTKEGLGVLSASGLTADRTWHLEFELPPVIPTGTAKLVLKAVANATSGDAKVNPQWAGVDAEEDSFNVSLNAEGTQTITWAAGDAYVEKELKVTLDADAGGINAGEMIKMSLVFEDTGYTLAANSVWKAYIIWE